MWTKLLFLTVCCMASTCCSGLATLEIQMISYKNPASRDMNGDDCDFFMIQGVCSHYFKFCLDHFSTQLAFDHCHCGLYLGQTDPFYKTNYTKQELIEFAEKAIEEIRDRLPLPLRENVTDIPRHVTYGFGGNGSEDVVNVFGSDMNGVPNPVTIQNMSWTGNVTFSVEIVESDVSSGFGLTDQIFEILQLSPDPDEANSVWINATFHGMRAYLPSSLNVKIRLYCEDGYLGPYCNCQPVDCYHIGHYECSHDVGKVCLPDWQDPDTNCTTSVNDCQSDSCEHGGTCLGGHMNYTCICAPGYTGGMCETNVDECQSAPCKNSGQCTDEVNGFTCSCPSQYVGPTCQSMACVDDTDCHNGTCDVPAGTCNCQSGYGDPNCDTRLCDVIKCLNGGVCQYGICACADGFTGSACEFQLCDFAHCLNGGMCIALTAQCQCEWDFTGVYCESSTGTCSLSCGDNGKCWHGQCNCYHGYAGQYCEIASEGTNDGEDWLVPIIITVLCTCALIALIIPTMVLIDRRISHPSHNRRSAEPPLGTAMVSF